MFVIEVKQDLIESQRASIKTQLLNVGIQVLIKFKRGQPTCVGYVDSFTGTDPIKVKVRWLNEDLPTQSLVEDLQGTKAKKFKFVVKCGRFVLYHDK